jgi:hypothetical protein
MSFRTPPKTALHLAHSAPLPLRRATSLGQMSPANAFEGPRLSAIRWPDRRRRQGSLSLRSVTFACVPDRDAFMGAWGQFVRATTRDRDHCAKVYATTFQTACNWYDGTRVPTGDKVAHAYALHPGPAAMILGAA